MPHTTKQLLSESNLSHDFKPFYYVETPLNAIDVVTFSTPTTCTTKYKRV